MGWVRNEDDGTVVVHAEGQAAAVDALAAFLREGPPGAGVQAVNVEEVKVEGHEQFAIRGVSAGVFVVQEHAATARHFDLRLEVEGAMRSWAVPKGPSLDPRTRRLAVPVEDHDLEAGDFEGVHEGHRRGSGAVIVWDEGPAEIVTDEPGHMSFTLRGSKLNGGFALTRTGERRWILVKARDGDARPGSDIVAESPTSVRSGKTWQEVAAR